MSEDVIVQLDDDVEAILAEAAQARGLTLAALLEELAAAETKQARNRRIREQSAAAATDTHRPKS